MNDPRFGIVGQSEPQICAISGEHAPGRHLNAMGVSPNGVYYILAKHAHKWTETLHAEMQAAFTALVTPQEIPVNETPQKKGK